MNAQIDTTNIRRLNRNIRGWGFVELLADFDPTTPNLVRVRDCETGITYPAEKSTLRKLTRKHTKEYIASLTPNTSYLEDLVADLLAKLKRSGFWDSGIAEARYLNQEKGYAWDVALSISCEYWCR